MHRSCVSDQSMQLPLQGRLLISLFCTFHFLLPFEKCPGVMAMVRQRQRTAVVDKVNIYTNSVFLRRLSQPLDET
jgi:hypothetical protein